MIKFFRRIRQKLLSQNRFNKYLLYAIGEIILVVIGILIALQINNWNEQEKQKASEQQLLIALKVELSENLETLKVIIKEHEESLQACLDLRDLYGKDEREITNDSIRNLKLRVLNNPTYDPNHGILNSIISSGQISNINNLELKSLIASLNDKKIDAFENTHRIDQYRLDLFQPDHHNYLVKDSLVGFKLDNKLLLKSKKFFMWIISFRIQRRAGLKEERELLETMEYMLTLLDKEIINQ